MNPPPNPAGILLNSVRLGGSGRAVTRRKRSLPATQGSSGSSSSNRAFTLVELILVMSLLIIMAALITPTLKGFFAGRSTISETQRFMALVHYGQARAVADGIPMTLWIDASKNSYGLRPQPGYSDSNTNGMECKLADGLKIAVSKTTATPPTTFSQTGRIQAGMGSQGSARLPAINFSPEGSIVTATSVVGVSIQEAGRPAVWMGPTSDKLGYKVQDENTILANARTQH